MAKAEICSGVCGFVTQVETKIDGGHCLVSIKSECPSMKRLGSELTQVDPFREITFRGEGPLTLQMAAKHCAHAACPVPSGIIKAVEVEAGLALPVDVTIKISKSEE